MNTFANQTLFFVHFLANPNDTGSEFDGVAVEHAGTLVVPDGGLHARILRLHPSTFDPQTNYVTTEAVSTGGLILDPHSVALAPEPDAALATLVTLGMLAPLAAVLRRRTA